MDPVLVFMAIKMEALVVVSKVTLHNICNTIFSLFIVCGTFFLFQICKLKQLSISS